MFIKGDRINCHAAFMDALREGRFGTAELEPGWYELDHPIITAEIPDPNWAIVSNAAPFGTQLRMREDVDSPLVVSVGRAERCRMRDLTIVGRPHHTGPLVVLDQPYHGGLYGLHVRESGGDGLWLGGAVGGSAFDVHDCTVMDCAGVGVRARNMADWSLSFSNVEYNRGGQIEIVNDVVRPDTSAFLQRVRMEANHRPFALRVQNGKRVKAQACYVYAMDVVLEDDCAADCEFDTASNNIFEGRVIDRRPVQRRWFTGW